MPRASWKGVVEIGAVVCPVALYAAVSSADRIALHIVNRATGNRVRRQFVDSRTGKPVDSEDQVKGYDLGGEDYVVLDPEDIAAAVPDADKTLSVSAFVPCAEIDEVYIDKPYYLAPDGAHAVETYGLIREGLRRKSVAALARTVLFRRVRTVLIRPHEDGLVAATLNFDYEVRPAASAFADIPETTVGGEMLDLARHIIGTRSGHFDPAAFEDRYEAALTALVRAKLEGKPVGPKPRPKEGKVVDLLAALRESAGKTAPAPRKRSAPGRRKAG